MQGGLGQYVKAAFNARPLGMFVPPNWVGLAAVGLLGLVNPGFWAIGAGLELAYLLGLSSSSRFRKVVDGAALAKEREQWQAKLGASLAELPAEDQHRYRTLERRCAAILDRPGDHASESDTALLGRGLGRLLWIYLRLLTTRQALLAALRESKSVDVDPLEHRLHRVRAQLTNDRMGEDLRKSLAGQADILEQRIEKRREAREKLAFLDAELRRIEEQAELIREQALVTSEPHALSGRIDQVSTSLGETSEWIRDQRRIYGQVEDELSEPPPALFAGAAAREQN